jgi:hypothetical protein
MMKNTEEKEWRLSLRKLVTLWPLIIPILIFVPGLGGFPYPSLDSAYSDITVSHYPNALYLKAALFERGEIPFWSSAILSGYPFWANPLSGMWYPPGWLGLILPLPLGFNLLVMLHLLWGGLGLYLLLRWESVSHFAALLGAIAFEAMPKLAAHFGAGHLSLLYAVPWTPWLILAQRTGNFESWAFDEVKPRDKWRLRLRDLLTQPGVILAVIFLADVRWLAFCGILWLGYAVSRQFQPIAHSLKIEIGQFKAAVADLILQVLFAICLTAPALFPFMEYVTSSTRNALLPDEAFTLSLPPERLLGLIYPDMGGAHEWMLYPGLGILILVLVVWSGGVRRKGKIFWSWVLVLSLIYALGSHIPGLALIARLPGFNLMRVPSRALFISGLAFAVLAAYASDELIKTPEGIRQKPVNLTVMALVGFGLALFVGMIFLLDEVTLNIIWGVVMMVLASLWVSLWMRARVPLQVWIIGLFAIILLDLGFVNQSLFVYRPKDDVLMDGKNIAQYLADQGGLFRVYSPSYSLPQHTAAEYRLELVDGVDPLQLTSYADFLVDASGVPLDGYSVTLPPFASGEPATDNQDYLPDSKLLGWLNARYLVSAFDLTSTSLELKELFGEVRVYENLYALPRSWVQAVNTQLGEDIQPADIELRKSNRIQVRADGPGLLVLSEIFYPKWKAKVDGQAVEVVQVEGLLRGVQLDPGEHQVEFYYVPISLYTGLGILLIGFILWYFIAARRETIS